MTICLASVALATNAANITASYIVQDAVSTHGLWTAGNNYNGDHSFNFQSNALLTQFDDGTATLRGSAADSGVTWDLFVDFSGFSPTPLSGGTKNGGGPTLFSWEFYGVVGGHLTNSLGDTVSVTRTGPAMQIGIGANDKNGAFGASTWLTPTTTVNGSGVTASGHWDLNMTLVAVPGPASLLLLGLGLLALPVARRIT